MNKDTLTLFKVWAESLFNVTLQIDEASFFDNACTELGIEVGTFRTLNVTELI